MGSEQLVQNWPFFRVKWGQDPEQAGPTHQCSKLIIVFLLFGLFIYLGNKDRVGVVEVSGQVVHVFKGLINTEPRQIKAYRW